MVESRPRLAASCPLHAEVHLYIQAHSVRDTHLESAVLRSALTIISELRRQVAAAFL